MSAPGIDVTALGDGNVRIEARTPKGTVKLTVTREYARGLADRLLAVAGNEPPKSKHDEIVETLRAAIGRAAGGR